MNTVDQFTSLLKKKGSDVRFLRDGSTTQCPCLTKQGYRDPIWHIDNPEAPVCNDAGMLTDPDTTSDFMVRAFMQPVQSGAVRRLTNEILMAMFGEVQSDDYLGMFPVIWNGHFLNFYQWGSSTQNFIEFTAGIQIPTRRWTVVSQNLIMAPDDNRNAHHWEIGLRLIRDSVG